MIPKALICRWVAVGNIRGGVENRVDCSSGDWVFVEEVSLAGTPKPSLQGCINGGFCNKYPVIATDSIITEIATPRANSIAAHNILTQTPTALSGKDCLYFSGLV